MANFYYTVVQGDTLAEIAQTYNSQYGTTEQSLATLNNLKGSSPYSIYVGQRLLIDGILPATEDKGTAVTVTAFGLQADTNRTIFVMWDWKYESSTEYYEVRWTYKTSDSALTQSWFIGSYSSTQNFERVSIGETQQSTYNAPENAIAVRVTIKPIPATKTFANNTTTTNWTGAWSEEKIYKFGTIATVPVYVPALTINNYQLEASVDGIAEEVTHIEFHVVQDNTLDLSLYSDKIPPSSGHISYACAIQAGSVYKVRCRAYKGDYVGAWSAYSSNANSLPSVPRILDIKIQNETSIKFSFTKINTASSYCIQYVVKDATLNHISKEEYFDVLGSSNVQSISFAPTNAEIDESTISRNILGLTKGGTYFIRVQAINSNNVSSNWSEVDEFIIGTQPTVPTTWCSTTSAIVGEPLKLYFIHNSKDGSAITNVNFKYSINDVEYNSPPIPLSFGHADDSDGLNMYSIDRVKPDDEYCNTFVININTNHRLITEGAIFKWKVSTSGALKTDVQGSPNVHVFSDWSVERLVNVYAPPTLSINLTNYDDTAIDHSVSYFPFNIIATAGTFSNQTVIGYYLSITSLEDYETIDNFGNDKNVKIGDAIYSEYFDIALSTKEFEISANKATFENNVDYKVSCTVSMNSGLTASTDYTIRTSFSGNGTIPFAEMGIDKNTLSAYIRPYSSDDCYLSVYRREFDGSFTEIAEDLDSDNNTFVTDPHPSLDYARYRIIAKNKSTGAITYNDQPGYLVGEKSAILQWNEKWTNFETTEDEQTEKPAWSGTLLKLPYNIDISDNNKPDVSLVEYIGRKYPVSYYGTHVRGTATWNMVIPKDDKNSLYALRRLSIWMGDVYVREPSGSGYWANVSVSFSQKHKNLTIPVTLNITRVDGGK